MTQISNCIFLLITYYYINISLVGSVLPAVIGNQIGNLPIFQSMTFSFLFFLFFSAIMLGEGASKQLAGHLVYNGDGLDNFPSEDFVCI